MDPVREIPKSHECVCLRILRMPVLPDVEDLAKLVAGEFPTDLIRFRDVKDKCHAIVNNPDQPFCDDCELAEHHLAEDQIGLQTTLKEPE